MTEDFEGRVPKESELDDINAMLTRAYVAGREDFANDPEVLRAYSTHDPGGGPGNWVVLWDGERPVSALRLFIREVSTENGTQRVGGIGNVGTDPDLGRKGLASRTMELAHDRLRAEGIGTAILVTDIPAFYERLGYRAVPQAEFDGNAGIEVSAPRRGERFTGAEAPEWMQELHRSWAEKTPGRVIRSDEYWRRWILEFKVRTMKLDLGTVEGSAYIIGRGEEDGKAYRILEGAGSPLDLAGLVTAAAGAAGRLKYPDDPCFREATQALGAKVVPRVRTGIMALALVSGAAEPEDLAGYLELDTF